MSHFFFVLIEREFKIILRKPEDLLNPLLFFLMVTSLFPLAFNAHTALLQQIGPGLIWVTALLATMLGLDRMFRDDFEDGSLELMLLSSQPLPLMVICKVLVHWLTAGLPIVILAPVLGLMLHLPWLEIKILLLSLLLGTPILSLLGAIIAALTLLLGNNGLLLSFLLLPLYIPVLIFGAGSAVDAGLGMQVESQLLILAALLLLALSTSPFVVSSALKIGYE